MKKIFEYPRIFFGLIITLQTALLINSRALYFSDEIRYANAYSNVANFNKWLVLYLNGEPYPDKPPVYFWLVYIVQSVTQFEVPAAMFMTSALTGFIYLLAHYYFSMTVTQDKKISIISGLILLTNFYFIALMNYIRMDLLFAALTIFSFTFLYKYLTTDSKKYVYFGFLVASVAVLTKGPIGVVFPLLFFLVGVVFFKAYKKLFSIHFLLGFLTTLVPIIGWLLAIVALEGYDYMMYLINTQVVKRAVKTWHHAEPFYYYTYALTLAWLPWVLIFFTSGKSIKSKCTQFYRSSDGAKYVIFAIVSGFLFLSALSGKIAIYALPIYSPIAILIAYVYINSDNRKIFWRAVSIFFIVLSGVLFFVNKIPSMPGYADNSALCGGVALASGLAIWFLSDKDNMKAVVGFALIMTLFFNVLGLTLIPSLDIVLSPKKQGTIMKQYIADGYKPVAYKVYSALYTYYAGSVVYETKKLDEVKEIMNSDEKVVLGLAEKYWKRWENKPSHLKIIDKQWIAGRDYLLVINK
ncbi:MAG: hypothetical protein C0603_12090 [Denitrovibrio sp.]|nr:MAG: hypothetical protein C0603_12090 [Denitrovibrio sp.]